MLAMARYMQYRRSSKALKALETSEYIVYSMSDNTCAPIMWRRSDGLMKLRERQSDFVLCAPIYSGLGH